MNRTIVIIVVAALVVLVAGLTIHAVVAKPAPPQNCQFLRWESKTLWPDGGGPPLPADC